MIKGQEIGVIFAVALIGVGAWWYGSRARTIAMASMGVPNVSTVNSGDVVPSPQTSNTLEGGNGDWSDVPDYLKSTYPGNRGGDNAVLGSVVIWQLADSFGPQSIPPQM